VSDRVLVEVAGGVLTATLNRADKRNAIDSAMIDALLAALERADLDATVRVVAVRGAGRDFCAGMDLNELLASADQTLEQNRHAALHFAQVFMRMRRLPKPIVALVQGRVASRPRVTSFWRRNPRNSAIRRCSAALCPPSS